MSETIHEIQGVGKEPIAWEEGRESYYNNPDSYTDKHPRAVTDPDRAHFTAHLMDKHETAIVKLRNDLFQHAMTEVPKETVHDIAHKNTTGDRARSGELTRGIADERRLADIKAKDASDIYDALKETKR